MVIFTRVFFMGVVVILLEYIYFQYFTHPSSNLIQVMSST